METGSFRALLIEDDPLAMEMARAAAAGHCSGLDLLAGVEAALGWLKGGGAESGQMPRIILIDLKLPKLEGLALLRTIRNVPAMRNIPVVVFSQEHTPADVVMAYRAGANSFVAKPADQAQFAELFREQIAYWTHAQRRETGTAANLM